MSNGSNHSSGVDIDIKEAKAIFEANATDLREVDFNLSMGYPSTKASTKSVINPKWDKPFVASSEKFTIFEVPLVGDVNKYAFTRSRKDGILQRTEMKEVTTKLILKRNNETGKYIYFIATMVGWNEDKSVKVINYTNNRSFTGCIFISDLNGICVGVYDCHSGIRRKAGFENRKTKAAVGAESAENTDSADGISINMFSTPIVAYSFGESAGSGSSNINIAK